VNLGPRDRRGFRPQGAGAEIFRGYSTVAGPGSRWSTDLDFLSATSRQFWMRCPGPGGMLCGPLYADGSNVQLMRRGRPASQGDGESWAVVSTFTRVKTGQAVDARGRDASRLFKHRSRSLSIFRGQITNGRAHKYADEGEPADGVDYLRPDRPFFFFFNEGQGPLVPRRCPFEGNVIKIHRLPKRRMISVRILKGQTSGQGGRYS